MYLMNGLVLGTWCRCALEEDMCRPAAAGAAAFMLAHNVASPEEVEPLLDRLAKAGGVILRHADAPTHGGLRGYVVDPDNHAWEILWTPGSRVRHTSKHRSELLDSDNWSVEPQATPIESEFAASPHPIPPHEPAIDAVLPAPHPGALHRPRPPRRDGVLFAAGQQVQ